MHHCYHFQSILPFPSSHWFRLISVQYENQLPAFYFMCLICILLFILEVYILLSPGTAIVSTNRFENSVAEAFSACGELHLHFGNCVSKFSNCRCQIFSERTDKKNFSQQALFAPHNNSRRDTKT